MTSKHIIVDGIDVSECRYFNKYQRIVRNNECIVDMQNACIEEIKTKPCSQKYNCYFKNWQRKEQECDELNLENFDLKDRLQHTEFVLETANKTIELKEQQLDQLKAENERLQEEREKAKNYNLEYGQLLIKATNKNNKLSKTLAEIKEIAKEKLNKADRYLILKKINECEEQ